MERDVERRKALPAFSIGVGELEVLWNRLLSLFENPEKFCGSIDIKLPSETLKFDNVEELKRYTQLRGRITNFTIYLSQAPRRISICSRSDFFSSAPTEVNANAKNEAWCAGAIETAHSFLQSHKVWYHWFVSAPLGWIVIIFMNLVTIANLFLPKEIVISKPVIVFWLTITVALIILYVTKAKLLPWSTLRISEDEGVIRRHVGEPTLLVALIALVVAFIQLFIVK